ncbi:MAG: replication initiation factor domain-containing protein, partial [Bacilli bacterium]|nr:replication initiation factor domain-containing protein [Bacilli bacterium]
RGILIDYFNIPAEKIIFEEGGLFGYDRTYSYLNIRIMESSKNRGLGTHIYLTGTGCRDIEHIGLNWYLLLNRLFTDFELNITRIDIAIDTFTDKYFTLDTIRNYIDNGQVLSRFKSSTKFKQQSLATAITESETIWFGSRTSNIQIVFYNKLMERKNASYKVRDDIKFWYRVETRFRNEVAYSFVQQMLSSGIALPSLINDVLYYYLDFKDYSLDSNKTRWSTSKWWLDFLETNKKLSLDINLKEASLVSKKQWLKDTVSKTEFMVFCADLVKENMSIDMISSNYIYNQLKSGFSKLLLSDKDISIINEYRLVQGLQPLNREDLYDIMQAVKQLLL